jgi:hypothetical protein
MTAIVGVEPGHAGRCRGESPRHSVMSNSTPALAMNARVGFETVPAAPSGANEDRADAGQPNNTGDARRELCPKGISDRPTARARAEGQPGQQTPVVVTYLT